MNRPSSPSLFHRLTDPLPEKAIQRLGRKGFGLCQLMAAGFRVPTGLILTINQSLQWNSTGGDLPDELLTQLKLEVTHLESLVGRRLGDERRPLFLAVRSGAVQSMPGLMRSILGIGFLESDLDRADLPGDRRQAFELLLQSYPELFIPTDDPQRGRTQPIRPWPTPWQQLTAAIRVVLASWNLPAAQAYRQRLNLAAITGTAVNIQVLEHVNWTGVLHTRHPDPSKRPLLLAEYASAESGVVSGRVTPARLEFTQHATHVSHPVSSAEHPPSEIGSLIQALADTAQRVENDDRFHDEATEKQDRCGFDIEWGWRDGELILFQIRPIATTFGLRSLPQPAPIPEGLFVKPSLAESLQHPTPLTWSLMQRLLAGDGALGTVYRQIGYRPGHSTYGGDYLQLIRGHIYAHPECVAKFFDCGIPFRYRREQFTQEGQGLESAPTVFDPSACGPWFLLSLPYSLLRYVRAHWLATPRLESIQRQQRDVFQRLSSWLEEQHRLLQQPLEPSSIPTHWRQAMRYVIDELPVATMSWALHAGVATGQLRRQLLRFLRDPQEASQLANQWIAQLADWPVTATLGGYWLQAALIDPKDFQQQFGHRGDQEWELAAATYRHSLSLDKLLASLTADPHGETARATFSKRKIDPTGLWYLPAIQPLEQVDAMIAERLQITTRSNVPSKLRRAAVRAAQLASSRDLGRDFWLRRYDVLRQWTERLAAHWKLDQHEPMDIFFLEWAEIDRYHASPEWAHRIANRRGKWEQDYELWMPRVLGAAPTKGQGRESHFPANELAGKVFQGVSISAGTARGTADNLVSLSDSPSPVPHPLGHTIFICPSLDTHWIPRILAAQGVITEQGGILSHAAVVARQCGIPVIQLGNACTLLRSGTNLQMDGSSGVITTK